ncbi:ribokinase [Lutimaribacter marinistellae]|uniref:Ribokinase n=1 Tax=Lutimaribacter marinistellae TaxID=1820329 RepID=A0ABV7TGB7_9RHOB
MAVWNLGSINADMVYTVPHLPGPGETLAALELNRFLGGKGANMSVAAARAAAHVRHIGAVGRDGTWAVERLMEYGVDTRHITVSEEQTGHAIIAVEPGGENQILIYPGANRVLDMDRLNAALSEADAGDTLVLQNETNLQKEAVQLARRLGMRVAYAAAPFEVDAVNAVLPSLDLLFLNAVEAEQLRVETGMSPEGLPVPEVIVTSGGEGAWYFDTKTGQSKHFPAHKVTAVDTTGAGDTFTGYVLAGLDRGLPMAQSIAQAMRAAAIMVTRHGTADVIPDLKDVQDAALA